MPERTIALEASWKTVLAEVLAQDEMRKLSDFLRAEKARGQNIYPPGSLIFNALNSTPLHQVKVVLLGQDPYHGAGQAHGLAFSVRPGVPIPPSLQNIFKELAQDLHLPIPTHGCLEYWAAQGVLLLNTTLTVVEGCAASHSGKGWEIFTDAVIAAVNAHCPHVVFLLWGRHAQSKAKHINQSRHLVLSSAHPSPLSAHRGFLGNRHFSKTNEFLVHSGCTPIDWQLPSQ